jgi:hypothetical protein
MTWAKENYHAKAKLYWSRATSHTRDSIDYFLNFALLMEFVVRAALVSRNPALNASRDDESLFYACGISTQKLPKTVDMRSAIAISRRLIPEINDEEASALAALVEFRNTEFHDDTTKFDPVILTSRIPDCQVLVLKLLAFSADPATAILSKDDAAQFEATKAAKSGDRKKRVRSLIESCKDRFFHLTAEQQESKRKAIAPNFVSAVTKGGAHIRAEKCPACSNAGFLGGRPISFSDPMLKENDIVVEVRVIPEIFDCKVCDLTIKGLDELLAAGFTHEFTSFDSQDIIEHFGIDPMDYIDMEEVARSYNQSAYEYNDE